MTINNFFKKSAKKSSNWQHVRLGVSVTSTFRQCLAGGGGLRLEADGDSRQLALTSQKYTLKSMILKDTPSELSQYHITEEEMHTGITCDIQKR